MVPYRYTNVRSCCFFAYLVTYYVYRQNNVEELFSLLKFLRIRPLNVWETFNEQINKPVKSGRSVRAMKRLQVVLKAIMLRRRKDTILNGKPLIKLPPRIVNINTCMFDSDEREFSEAIQSKVELTLNKFMKNGDMMKNYTSMLVLLLRLRQGEDLLLSDKSDYTLTSQRQLAITLPLSRKISQTTKTLLNRVKLKMTMKKQTNLQTFSAPWRFRVIASARCARIRMYPLLESSHQTHIDHNADYPV